MTSMLWDETEAPKAKRVEENQEAQMHDQRYILIGDRMTITREGHDLKRTFRN